MTIIAQSFKINDDYLKGCCDSVVSVWTLNDFNDVIRQYFSNVCDMILFRSSRYNAIQNADPVLVQCQLINHWKQLLNSLI